MRVLSGLQPTGRLHWGNYFGAVRQYLDLQHDHEGYYFVANLHALTTVRDAKLLAQYTRDVAIDVLALGLDPDRATLFIQSDVPEVSELCWILMSNCSMADLENCHAYKDKIAKGIKPGTGLFTYPVLMAADILIYDSNLVPVGQDQKQHVELARDWAGRFNREYGKEVFVLPQSKILDTSAKVPGVDGAKMSKSYDNTIEILEDAKSARKKCMRISTDSRPMEQPKTDYENDHLFQLYSLFATPEQRQAMVDVYLRGGFGYGQVKTALADLAEAHFAPARARRAELLADKSYVDDVLAAGANRARCKAREVLDRVQSACGIASR